MSPRTALAQQALQQHLSQFTPEAVCVSALTRHARRVSESSAESAASEALRSHAKEVQADRVARDALEDGLWIWATERLTGACESLPARLQDIEGGSRMQFLHSFCHMFLSCVVS